MSAYYILFDSTKNKAITIEVHLMWKTVSPLRIGNESRRTTKGHDIFLLSK